MFLASCVWNEGTVLDGVSCKVRATRGRARRGVKAKYRVDISGRVHFRIDLAECVVTVQSIGGLPFLAPTMAEVASPSTMVINRGLVQLPSDSEAVMDADDEVTSILQRFPRT